MSIAATRAERLVSQLTGNATSAGNNSLTVKDNRTGNTYTIPVTNNTVRASDLFKMKGEGVPGIRSYDPGFLNTAAATSRITFINGGAGQLQYRGYPIEQLAEKSTFLEVAFLLLYGELPSQDEYTYFRNRVMKHTYIHEDLKRIISSFRYNAHPMGMLVSTIAAMSTFHPEANPALAGSDIYKNKLVRNKQIHRLVGTLPTIAAFAYRHRTGRPFVDPSPVTRNLSYSENFMYMLDKLSDQPYTPNPRLAKALDVLFILHADHELNCSTAAMRHLTSSGVDVYTAVSAAAGALYGPLHGGANEAVLRMLEKIGSKDNIPSFIEDVKARKVKLMGFGHRVYKNYDPRARLVAKIAQDVFSIVGKEPLIEVAKELEQIALSDPYFIKRKLYPNVDFYSGLIYKAMGFPTDFFPVLFAIPRTVGWLSHWQELLDDKENKIARPHQVFLGSKKRDYVQLTSSRPSHNHVEITSYSSAQAKRRDAGKMD